MKSLALRVTVFTFLLTAAIGWTAIGYAQL